MNRTRISHLLCILLLLGSGCSWSWKTRAKTWSKSQVESKVKEAAKLSEVRLTETGNGNFEGIGKGQDGTAYRVKATYVYTAGEGKNSLRWEVEDAKGQKSSGQQESSEGGGGSISVGR